MQTLSDMQRSLSYQKSLIPLFYLPLFFIYSALGSIYLLLPPLLGLLFYLFERSYEREQLHSLLLVSAMLLIFEAEKGYLFFSSLLYFFLLSKLLVPFLKQYIVCEKCLMFIYVALAYLGYYLMMVLISQIFILEFPSIDIYVIYYILIEFLIISLL